MRVSPLMICRTKYVDYNDPVFCAASDLSLDFQRKLHDIIINGNNLKFADECKVFVSNTSHVIIGKVLYIKKLQISVDDSLDKETGGRSAWGFIGGSISRSEYVKDRLLQDLPSQYYIDVYTHCLYENHWREEAFQGPYRYAPMEVKMEIMKEIIQPFVEEVIPIYPETKNDYLFQLAIKKTLNGQTVAFCSNEEFNAAEAISKNALTFATVSEVNLRDQVESYSKIISKTQKSDPIIRQNAQQHTDHDSNDSSGFFEEFKELCRKYNYSYVTNTVRSKKTGKPVQEYIAYKNPVEEEDNYGLLGSLWAWK